MDNDNEPIDKGLAVWYGRWAAKQLKEMNIV